MLALRLIFKDKGGKQHCLPFVASSPGGCNSFEKEETSEKDALK